MQQNAFVQSMKTIAQNAITKAGFDKTRNGRIVGVNSVTNTYSVKVDGIVYNNVKVVNDYEYNVGDIVKINIPMNNPSQAYISSSVLSDDSIGKKLADTITLLDELDDKVDSITDIMGDIYQLSVSVSYANSGDYVIATYTAILSKNGEDITSDHDEDEFEWYMEKTTGRTTFDDSPAYSIQLSTEDYYYGQAVLLEWTYTYTDDDGVSQTVQLRYRVTLFSPTTLEGSSKYTTELSSSGVFVHRADGNYDVGNDYESTYAYGVKIADTVDIIKGGYVWGTFGGSYLVVGRTADYYNNIYMNVGGDSSSTGSIQFRNGTTVLSEMTNSSVTVGQTSGFNTYIGTLNIYMRYNGTILANWTSTTLTLGKTSTYNTYIDTYGVHLRNNGATLADFTQSGMTLKNSSGDTIASYTIDGTTINSSDSSVVISSSNLNFVRSYAQFNIELSNYYNSTNNYVQLSFFQNGSRRQYIRFGNDLALGYYIYIYNTVSISSFLSCPTIQSDSELRGYGTNTLTGVTCFSSNTDNSPLVTVRYSLSFTKMSAGDSRGGTTDISKSGFTALGVVGAYASDPDTNIIAGLSSIMVKGSATIQWQVRAIGNAVAAGKLYVDVLWMRN